MAAKTPPSTLQKTGLGSAVYTHLHDNYGTGRAKYVFHLDTDTTFQALEARYYAAQKELEAVATEGLAHAKNLTNLPPRYTLSSVDITGHHKTIRGEVDGFMIEQPPKAAPADPLTPLEQLRNHPQLTQILNCGALSKDEKRQLLGLPAADTSSLPASGSKLEKLTDKDGWMPIYTAERPDARVPKMIQLKHEAFNEVWDGHWVQSLNSFTALVNERCTFYATHWRERKI